MVDTKEQVVTFLSKCEELKKCKFIMATTKIKDVLKCIVNCPELYRLFEAVTKNFDYREVKKACLVTTNDGIFERSYVVLPQTVGQRLAFIFCLLVEFDRGTVNFNDFLEKYYPEDGSFVASYHGFCDTVIKGLQDAVVQVFKDELAASAQEDMSEADNANAQRAELISILSLAITEEIEFIEKSNVPEEDKEGGIKILLQLDGAIKACKEDLVDALICGYNYFVMYHNCYSEGFRALIEAISLYEHTL